MPKKKTTKRKKNNSKKLKEIKTIKSTKKTSTRKKASKSAENRYTKHYYVTRIFMLFVVVFIILVCEIIILEKLGFFNDIARYSKNLYLQDYVEEYSDNFEANLIQPELSDQAREQFDIAIKLKSGINDYFDESCDRYSDEIDLDDDELAEENLNIKCQYPNDLDELIFKKYIDKEIVDKANFLEYTVSSEKDQYELNILIPETGESLMLEDGGDDPNLYEIGSDLFLIKPEL